jgi:hypothetical protein
MRTAESDPYANCTQWHIANLAAKNSPSVAVQSYSYMLFCFQIPQVAIVRYIVAQL